MTKQDILKHANYPALIHIIAQYLHKLTNDLDQEYCLEEIYESLANTYPKPSNFALLSNDAKAQLEIDIDMVLISIDFQDLKKTLFEDEANVALFWSLVDNKEDKKSQKVFKTLFV